MCECSQFWTFQFFFADETTAAHALFRARAFSDAKRAFACIFSTRPVPAPMRSWALSSTIASTANPAPTAAAPRFAKWAAGTLKVRHRRPPPFFEEEEEEDEDEDEEDEDDANSNSNSEDDSVARMIRRSSASRASRSFIDPEKS